MFLSVSDILPKQQEHLARLTVTTLDNATSSFGVLYQFFKDKKRSGVVYLLTHTWHIVSRVLRCGKNLRKPHISECLGVQGVRVGRGTDLSTSASMNKFAR